MSVYCFKEEEEVPPESAKDGKEEEHKDAAKEKEDDSEKSASEDKNPTTEETDSKTEAKVIVWRRIWTCSNYTISPDALLQSWF